VYYFSHPQITKLKNLNSNGYLEILNVKKKIFLQHQWNQQQENRELERISSQAVLIIMSTGIA